MWAQADREQDILLLSEAMLGRFTKSKVLRMGKDRVGRLSMCSELTAWSVHDKVVSAVNSWMCRSELRVRTSLQVKTFSHPSQSTQS